MFLLAHTGVTLGAAWLSQTALAKASFFVHRKRRTGESPGGLRPRAAQNPSRPVSLASQIDYRLVLLGSLLPDILDKPFWLLEPGGFFSSGRSLGHSLLFGLLLVAVGAYVYARHRSLGIWLVAFGSLTHLVLDEMWHTPRVLLWPLHGWDFPRSDMSHSLRMMLEGVLKEPHVGIPEIIGGLILAGFFFYLVRRKGLARFLRTGTLG